MMERQPESKLEVSGNSWAAQQRARRKGSTVEDSEQPDSAEVVRTVKSILNKLTIEKFPNLYRQLISCGIRTVEHLEILIAEIFDKATTQVHFIDMYADLCARLNEHFTQNTIEGDGKVSFKKLLLSACQNSFE